MQWSWSSLGHLKASLRFSTLLAIVLLQAASAVFFIGDVFWEFRNSGLVGHTGFEGLATLGLVLGVLFGVFEMARIQRSADMAENSLKIAADAFGDLIRDRFETWALSNSEREVALLTLKGFDVNEIARFRNTATSTVRAQQASIYAKSCTHNRGQFVSSFIDALVETPLVARQTG
jgi:DNA-binding CsgD family transcriptional regulator